MGETVYTETEVIIAALDDDKETLIALLLSMTPSEVARLTTACDMVVETAARLIKTR